MRSMTQVRKMLAVVMLAGALTGAAPLERQGPPALCEALDIGQARSLPMKGPMECDPSLTPAAIRAAVLDVLNTSDDALVHMETLRRAVLSCEARPELAPDLIILLQSRALDAAASGRESALAWLDAGYTIGLCRQLSIRSDLVNGLGVKLGVPGYAYLDRAARLSAEKKDGHDGAIHLASASLTFPLMHMSGGEELPRELTAAYREHVRRAGDLAKEGTLLAANVKSHTERFTKWVDAESAR